MITYLISLSLLIAAVIIVRALFRRSVPQRVIYALWLVVLVRICLPFQIFAVEMPSFTAPVLNITEETTTAPETTVSPIIPDVTVPAPSVTVPSPSVSIPAPVTPVTPITPVTPSETVASETGGSVTAALPESIPPVLTPETPKTQIDIPWTKVLYTAWAAGSVIFALALAVSAMNLSLKLKCDREYYMNLGKTKVYVSESARSPMLWGIVPVIYLTPDKKDSEAYSLVHEQTHLRHGDHIWSVVRVFALVLFWWNPLVWAAVYLSKQDAELACDETIASRLDENARIEYANVIVNNIPRRGTLATGLASAPIKERIIMITRKNNTRWLCILLALVLTLGAVGCSFIGPKDPTPPDPSIESEADIAVAALDEKLGKKFTQYLSGVGTDNTLLISYIGDDREPLLYATTDGENFNKVVIEIPKTYTYNNADIAYIYPNKIMIELEFQGVYTYIEFLVDQNEIFDGVLSKDECYLVDYLTSPLSFMKTPCTNFPITYEAGNGPFAAYVQSDTSEYIDVYKEKYPEKREDVIASIPWDVIADFPATEKAEGWLPYSVWYGETDEFCWAVIAGGVHLGSDNRNFCLSRDGGKTWEIGESAKTRSGLTSSAIFISEDIGLMGYERGAYNGIVIARTDDGGKNWERVEIEVPTGLADFTQTTPRSFNYDGKTITCTISLEEGIGPNTSVDILSTDGGVTWQYEYNWSEKIGTYHTVISNSGTREAYFVPAAMYGYKMGDGIAYTSFEKNTNSYWTTLRAGGDSEFCVVFGTQNDYKTQGDFDAYTTYHVTAKNGRIFKTELVETITKELVLASGKAYDGELKGTYKAKSFSRGDGLTSYTFLFNNGNIEFSAYRAGSGAGGTYNGTYTYDKTSGKLSANLSFTTVENGMTKTSLGHNFTAKVYEYDGFIHFIITDSGLSMIDSNDLLPITFRLNDRPTDFDMMSNILISSALTEAQLAGEAVSDEVIRYFIGLSCVSYYRENGFIYSKYWRLIDDGLTWYMSRDDAARIAYEVFGAENYSGGEITIPNGIGLGSSNDWRIAVMTEEQNGDTAVLTCKLVGDDITQPSDKVFGNYRFTFKYITEGERGFWRYIGAEEIEHLYTDTLDAYDCKAVYFDYLSETYGKYRISLPLDSDKYDIRFSLRYCDDGCEADDITAFMQRVTTGAAPVYNCVQSYTKGTGDGYNFATRRFEWSIPEMMKPDMTEESIRETETRLAKMYDYILSLGGGYFACVYIEVKGENTADAAREIEEAVKNATATHTAEPDEVEIAIKKSLSAARSVEYHLRYNPTAAQISSTDKIEVNGMTYYRVIPSERFPYDTWDGMIEYLEQFFSPALTARLLAETGRFAERDGILYQSIREGYIDNSLHTSTLEIIKESDRKYIARVTTKVVDINDRTQVTGEVTFDYPFEYIRGSWVFTDLPKQTSNPVDLAYYPISEHYSAYLTRDMRTVHIRKIGESENLLSISCDSTEGLHHMAFLPGSTILTLSEDEKTLVVNYISNIDPDREGATLFDLEAKQVRSHYLPRPEEIIAVNDPTGELAKKFQPYIESGQWQITCTAKADGMYIELIYELVTDTISAQASTRVSNSYYYGNLQMSGYVPNADAAEFLDEFERAREAYYWFDGGTPTVNDPTGKVIELRGLMYAPIESDRFTENNITDLESLEKYLNTVFTEKATAEFMSKCADVNDISTDDNAYYVILYHNGILYVHLGGRGTWPTSDPIFILKEKSDNTAVLAIYVYDARYTDIKWVEFEAEFVRSGDVWLCDSFPHIW